MCVLFIDLILASLLVFEGPELFKNVRGIGRIHFHEGSSKSDHKALSYDQARKKYFLNFFNLVFPYCLPSGA